jgi:hypothetical protein
MGKYLILGGPARRSAFIVSVVPPLDLSRFRSAPSAHLSGLSFESQALPDSGLPLQTMRKITITFVAHALPGSACLHA